MHVRRTSGQATYDNIPYYMKFFYIEIVPFIIHIWV